MKTVQISLNSIDKVKSFVNDISKFDFDFDLVSGRYVIDAKSGCRGLRLLCAGGWGKTRRGYGD